MGKKRPMSDQANADFWDELCGSGAARSLGIADASKGSLLKFDSWYFEFYPYLKEYVSRFVGPNAKVLEVGLGFGTLSQWLGEQGSHLVGLDIARGPVEMFNARFFSNGLQGEAVQGSILNPPFENESFDLVVAIGSLHHTGDLRAAITNCHSLLRPGGVLVLMVYNAYSYRRWVWSFSQTLRYLRQEKRGYRGVVGLSKVSQRAAYDKNLDGHAAPHTDFVSEKSLRHLLEGFSQVEVEATNVGAGFPFNVTIRLWLLKSRIPRYLGLDLYATCQK